VDHGLGDIASGFIVANEAAPAGHPAEGALDDLASGQQLEAWFSIDPADDLDDQVQEGGLVHELAAIIGAVGEEMLEPGPVSWPQKMRQ